MPPRGRPRLNPKTNYETNETELQRYTENAELEEIRNQILELRSQRGFTILSSFTGQFGIRSG